MKVRKKLLNSYRIIGLVMSAGLLAILVLSFLNILNIKSIIPVMLMFIGIILTICASCEVQVNNSIFIQICSIGSLALIICGIVMMIVQLSQGSFNLLLK